jgi:hypothetical protein
MFGRQVPVAYVIVAHPLGHIGVAEQERVGEGPLTARRLSRRRPEMSDLLAELEADEDLRARFEIELLKQP